MNFNWYLATVQAEAYSKTWTLIGNLQNYKALHIVGNVYN
jgi:hypothetical protein